MNQWRVQGDDAEIGPTPHRGHVIYKWLEKETLVLMRSEHVKCRLSWVRERKLPPCLCWSRFLDGTGRHRVTSWSSAAPSEPRTESHVVGKTSGSGTSGSMKKAPVTCPLPVNCGKSNIPLTCHFFFVFVCVCVNGAFNIIWEHLCLFVIPIAALFKPDVVVRWTETAEKLSDSLTAQRRTR